MSLTAQTHVGHDEPIYPESDGRPMAENTLQFQWIVTIEGGLDALFRDRPDVFVAGDLLWYPVEGSPKIRAAPDALVVFGRPKGHRGSYLQWREDDIPPQVVFEVLSPGNRPAEVVEKFLFYQRYGVEEFYVYDPQTGELTGWVRANGGLEAVPEMRGWVSPRLGVRFDLEGDELRLSGPDGRRFLTYLELAQQRDEATHQRNEAARERDEALARIRELQERLANLEQAQ
jgi:Uma2 family endonuclease